MRTLVLALAVLAPMLAGCDSDAGPSEEASLCPAGGIPNSSTRVMSNGRTQLGGCLQIQSSIDGLQVRVYDIGGPPHRLLLDLRTSDTTARTYYVGEDRVDGVSAAAFSPWGDQYHVAARGSVTIRSFTSDGVSMAYDFATTDGTPVTGAFYVPTR